MLYSRDSDSIRRILHVQHTLIESQSPFRPQPWKQTPHPEGGYVSTVKTYTGEFETAHVHPEHGTTILNRASTEGAAAHHHHSALQQPIARRPAGDLSDLVPAWQKADTHATRSQDPEARKRADSLYGQVNQHIEHNIRVGRGERINPHDIRQSIASRLSAEHAQGDDLVRQAAKIHDMRPHPTKPNMYVHRDDTAADQFDTTLSDLFPKRRTHWSQEPHPEGGSHYVVGLHPEQ